MLRSGAKKPVKGRRSKTPPARKPTRRHSPINRSHKQLVKRLKRERDEALEQQTATASVLKVISRSAFDLQTVLQTLVESAARLCDAEKALIYQSDGKLYSLAAAHGVSREFEDYVRHHPIFPGRGTTASRAALEGRTIHIPDVLADPEYTGADRQSRGNFRSTLGVPLLRGGETIGIFSLLRVDVRPYTEKQIELATTFADQAVIAIENTRLFDEVQAKTCELEESLQQQTATADVLKVISRSVFDLQAVLKALVGSAVGLAGAFSGAICIRDGETFRYRAGGGPGYSEELQRFIESMRVVPGRGSIPGRVLLSGKVEEIPDVLEDREYKIPLASLGLPARALLGVPLLGKEGIEGSLTLTRREPGRFAPRIIELMQTFADQAVIAIENARLFNETKEALERQTATSDILKVIASNPADVQPVFEAIVNSAAKLFEPCAATITTLEGGMLHFNATAALQPGYNVDHAKSVYPIPFEPGRSPSARAILERRIIEIPDTAMPDTPEYTRRAAKAGGFRSVVFVPLVSQESGIGTIILTHPQAGFRLLEKQLALVRTFADQAVIAIQNAQLFNEVQAKTRDLEESLQQQTATSDVLKVISRSAFDLEPVFRTIVQTASRLCEAEFALIYELHGDKYEIVAFNNAAEAFVKHAADNPLRPGRGSLVGRTALERKPVHIPDCLADREYSALDYQTVGHYRALLGVPLLREGVPIGVIAMMRTDVRPFTEKQIELVTTFADQAVIAVENVRLFDEVQARTRELAKSLDDLRAAQDRLIQTEKLASLGQLTAGIAHEIKNPLNFVNNFSALSVELTDELNDLLKQAELAEKMRFEVGELTQMLKSNLEKVVQHGKRADSIVKNMLLHSREGAGERRSVGINSLVEESLNLAYHGARAEKAGFSITLKHDLDPEAGAVDLHPQEITRALLNLISNGFYAATRRRAEADDEGFEPILSAATRNLGKTVEIRIRDNGSGIPREVKEKIFIPFFTTKPTGEGTGLGLSMTHDIIVKQHGGRIDVETKLGEFTEFIVTLPRDNRAVVADKSE